MRGAAAGVWFAVAALVAIAPVPAQADDYPSRTVTIVAPAAPGGLYSLFARLIATRLEQRFGKTFVVENRPGASSIVGVTSVLRAPHDGHNLIVMNSTGMAVNPSLHKNLPYDPVNDLAPIALLARTPEVLVVNAALPVHSLADLASLARQTPGGLSYASPGAGTSAHLSGVLLGSVLGVPLTHVPYKGMQPAIGDVTGGHVPFMFSPVPFAIPLAQAGKIRMIGVTTAERVPSVPDVPPLTEIGLKSFDSVSWFMLAAAAGTPEAVVERLARETRTVIDDLELQAEFGKLGVMPVRSPAPAELRRFVEGEIARFAAIVQKAGLASSQ